VDAQIAFVIRTTVAQNLRGALNVECRQACVETQDTGDAAHGFSLTCGMRAR
jgi:hypothetical protein